MTNELQTQIEAAAFRRLLQHLQTHTEVQNIDLMLVGDFCRNCLAKWYAAEAAALGEQVDYEAARDHVYGMPYSEWKQRYQQDATPEQLAAYAKKQEGKHEH